MTGRQHHVFDGAEAVERPHDLMGEAETESNPGVHRQRGDIAVVEEDATGVGTQQARH